MEMANIHQTKTHLSKMLERVAAGEEIIIAKAGKPVAKLVPFHAEERPRVPGFWQGQVRMSEDFDELPEEISAAFRGERP